MNLSDELFSPQDPASLLTALRKRRQLRTIARLSLTSTALICAGLLLHQHRGVPSTIVATVAPPPSLTLTRDELLDSLKNQTLALIQWPDGREELLIQQ